MPTVRFFAGLRTITGAKEIPIAAGPLRKILDDLVAAYPALHDRVWDGQALRPHVIVTINGHNLDPARGLDIPVQPEDEIAIFPPIAGG